MSRLIRFLSGSPWTHVALCVGRLEEYTQNADPTLRDPTLRDLIARASHGDPKEPVLIEALLGRGTVLTPLRRYRAHAVKICRPSSLSKQQVGRVIRFAVRHLGFDYDLRQILDLMRLAAPLPSFARRWRSNPVRPRLRGIQALYLLDAAGAGVHLCGPPRRRGGGAPQQCGLPGLFESEPAACDAERLRRIPLFRISRVST